VPLPIQVETGRPDAIVVVSFNASVSDDEFLAYLQRVEGRLALQRPFGMVLIATSSGAATATQRRMQASWLRENFDELRKWVWGAAFVLNNPVGRLTLASVLALQRLPYPHTVVATPELAFAWVRTRRAAGK
jgi:hypothetical protein